MTDGLTQVGIRELKAHLSRHMRRVRAGAHLIVTERGRAIGIISPVGAPATGEWAHRLVAEGRATWNGAKPQVTARVRVGKTRRTAASIVLEDRA